MASGRNETEYSVRRLPSGRWQGRFKDPSGVRRSVGTFDTEREALEAAMEATFERRRGLLTR